MITPRQMYAMEAAIYLGMAIVVPTVLAFSVGEAKVGRVGIVVAAGVFLALAGFCWFRYRKTAPDAEFFDIRKQPPEQQIVVCKKAIWLMLVVGPAMSFFSYHDLAAVETGSKDSAMVWVPVALLYDYLGFWPAVLFCPVFCGFCIAMGFLRIAKAKAILARRG